MYINNKQEIVNDNESYIDSDGVKYPGNYPKDNIAELNKVVETEVPAGEMTEGFTVNDSFEQVWNIKEKTEAELNAELVAKAHEMLEQSDNVAVRCFKAGITFPSEWEQYVVDLRRVVNGELSELPLMPEYTVGS